MAKNLGTGLCCRFKRNANDQYCPAMNHLMNGASQVMPPGSNAALAPQKTKNLPF
jgi:hypothetical protein